MNKAEFNAWLAGALGALPEVASAGYNPEYPEDGVRLVMVNGYEVALGEVVPQWEDEKDEYYIEDEDEDEEDYMEYLDENEINYTEPVLSEAAPLLEDEDEKDELPV